MANYSFHKFNKTEEAVNGYCAAVGFFDGVHRGHRYLIERVKKEAAERGFQPIIISFEEHPRLALSQTRYWPELLTTNEEKLRLLNQTGIAGCVMLHFNQGMSMLTSYEFMKDILRDELNVKCLIVGYDHHFGSDLSSGYKDYIRYGRQLGLEVIREAPFEDDELRISSSATRRFLTGGNIEMARVCLGRPYLLEGEVVEGHKAGTLMGYPTANLKPDSIEQIIPSRGVYAVRVSVDGFTYDAMLNVGWRPTLDNGSEQSIEAHLFDYNGDVLYGKHIKVYFYRRVRDEKRFESIEALQEQLAVDSDVVKQMLAEE